jgi:hypothetical protein
MSFLVCAWNTITEPILAGLSCSITLITWGRAYPAWVPPIARFASRARTILPIFSEPEFFPIA